MPSGAASTTKYSNNPATTLNSFLSSFRNNVLSSSVAIVVFGFSNSFKLKTSTTFVRAISVGIFALSLCIGVNTIYALRDYIKKLEKDRDSLPPYVNLRVWYNHMYIAMGYNCFLLVMLILAVIRFSNNHPELHF